MNIAIIIGVSEYQEQNRLPSCKNDAELINGILKRTKKYDKILFLNGNENTKSPNTKKEINNYIRQFQKEEVEVDELFFYYSGHGEIYGTKGEEEFYFLFADFEESKRNATSLKNSELDNMFRSLSPKIAFKVVDACQAGVRYIKGDIPIKDVFEKLSGYKSCYFFLSSGMSQNSIAMDDFSVFTKVFAESISSFPQDKMRYMDIVDYIADRFASTLEQTPIFVTQATHTEIFCDTSVALKSFITKELKRSYISSEKSPDQDTSQVEERKDNKKSLYDLVIQDAQFYCERDQVIEYFNQLKEVIESHQMSDDFRKLYDIEYDFSKDISKIENTLEVANWIKSSDGSYLAKVLYKTETYEKEVRVPKKSSIPWVSALSDIFGTEYEIKTVEKEREVVDSFEITADCPYQSVVIRAKPKHLNLSYFSAQSVPIFSRKEIVFFYAFNKLKEEDWGKHTIVSTSQWSIHESLVREQDKINTITTSLTNSFEEYVLKEIRRQFHVKKSNG